MTIQVVKLCTIILCLFAILSSAKQDKDKDKDKGKGKIDIEEQRKILHDIFDSSSLQLSRPAATGNVQDKLQENVEKLQTELNQSMTTTRPKFTSSQKGKRKVGESPEPEEPSEPAKPSEPDTTGKEKEPEVEEDLYPIKRPRFNNLLSRSEAASISSELLERLKAVHHEELTEEIINKRRKQHNEYIFFENMLKYHDFVEYSNILNERLRTAGNFGEVLEGYSSNDSDDDSHSNDHDQSDKAKASILESSKPPTSKLPSRRLPTLIFKGPRIDNISGIKILDTSSINIKSPQTEQRQKQQQQQQEIVKPIYDKPLEKHEVCPLCSDRLIEEEDNHIVTTYCQHKFHDMCLTASVMSQVSKEFSSYIYITILD